MVTSLPANKEPGNLMKIVEPEKPAKCWLFSFDLKHLHSTLLRGTKHSHSAFYQNLIPTVG